ncbi:MAG TPA: hypothetical protein ENO11_06665 [Desulfobacteraceae bacterium]|nr:hypothetical protein [Desulfobacteraceae bacterium]
MNDSTTAATVNDPSQPLASTASTVRPAALQVVANADSQPVDAPLVVSNGSPAGEIPTGSFAAYIGVYTSERSTCDTRSILSGILIPWPKP